MVKVEGSQKTRENTKVGGRIYQVW